MSASENGLSSLTRAAVTGMRRGIEKESLRAHPDGSLATTPHPAALGSPLTHAHITTDFSESQLELITGARTSGDEIPLGRYGSSNVGKAKTVYRMGLAHRYGRRMQTISGIHYNWSLPNCSTE